MVGARFVLLVALPLSGAVEWSDKAWGMTAQAGADLPPYQQLAAVAGAPEFAAPALRARADGALELVRVGSGIVFDGAVDEPAWTAVPALPMTRFRPDNGAAPSESTVVRIAYDAEYVWIAGALHDSEPSAIRVSSLSRDVLGGSDEFRILLDTFRDQQSGLIFGTNPAGLRWDAALSADGEYRGVDPVNVDWNGVWDVETARDERGWSFEMRIPLSTLRFQNAPDGSVLMGVVASRLIARRNEWITFRHLPEGLQGFFMKPSLARPVAFDGVKPSRPLQLTPYVLGGARRSAELNAAGTAYGAADAVTREIGVDLKYGLTNNLTLDVTLNTDFAQAEADAQQVNLSRFSLFLPEKRQFFQERAGVFDLGTGGVSRVFHSRRIGLSDDGVPLPILGGVRLVGRVGDWDVGVLDMQTGAAEGVAGENFGVVRVRRSVLNDNSYAGAMLTSRVGSAGGSFAGGVDASVRVSRSGYVSGAFAASDNAGDSAPLGERAVARVAFDRRTSRGLGLSTQLVYTGADYEPRMGFVQRRGVVQLNGWTGYGVFPRESSLRRFAPNVWANAFLRTEDGSAETVSFGHFWNVDFRSGAYFWVEGTAQLEDLREGFELAEGVDVAAGSYNDPSLWFGGGTPGTAPLRGWFSAQLGSFFGGRIVSGHFGPTWTISPRLELGAEYMLTRIDFAERAQNFDSDVVRLRITGALNTSLSAGALLQYNRAGGVAAANLRVRWNLAEGRDVYVVYNHTLDAARTQTPIEPLTRERQLLVKATWAFAP